MRYFHISLLPLPTQATAAWYMKLEPLASLLWTKFQAYVVLRQNISFDEIIVPFSRRSRHTLKMKNKPISKGFKVWALCDHGYLWDFLFYSRTSRTVGLKRHPELSPTLSAVLQLMKTLPYNTYQFTLFCDNLFGDPKLFSLLRSLGIGACGTARRHITKPVFGNIDDWNAAWGTLRSKIVPTIPDIVSQEPTTLVSV